MAEMNRAASQVHVLRLQCDPFHGAPAEDRLPGRIVDVKCGAESVERRDCVDIVDRRPVNTGADVQTCVGVSDPGGKQRAEILAVAPAN
jgi:hypothetical protein